MWNKKRAHKAWFAIMSVFIFDTRRLTTYLHFILTTDLDIG